MPSWTIPVQRVRNCPKMQPLCGAAWPGSSWNMARRRKPLQMTMMVTVRCSLAL